MPLQKATQSLPFSKGLDTKTDPKVSAKPTRLENLVFSSGDLGMRPGRKQLSASIAGGGTQSAGEALFSYGSELVRINGGTTYGLAQATNQWTAKSGGQNYCALMKNSLVKGSATQNQADRAVANGVAVLAWIETVGGQAGLHIAVYDIETGNFYQAGSIKLAGSDASPTQPRCLVLGSTVVILWATIATGKLWSTTVDTSSPSTAPTAATAIRTDLSTVYGTFDAVAYGTSSGAVVYVTSATDLKIFMVTTAGAVSASPAITTLAGVATTLQGILIQRDTAGNLYVVFSDSTTLATYYLVRSSALAAVLGKTTIVTNTNWSGGAANFQVGASYEVTTNTITLILATNGNATVGPVAGEYLVFLGKSVVNAAGIVTAFAELACTPGLWIVGDACLFDGVPVFGAVNWDPVVASFSAGTAGIQSTAWILDFNGHVIARALTGASGLTTGTFIRTARPYVSGASASFLFAEQGRVSFSNPGGGGAQATTPLGISEVVVTKTKAGVLPIGKDGQTAYVGGGTPRTFDGSVVTDAGFALYPTLIDLVLAAGGKLSAGQYQWKLLYSWVNARGELVRSIASPAITASPSANDKATLKIAPMPLSMRDTLPQGATVVIEVYRTEVNGTVFYRLDSVTAPTFNATTYAGTTSGTIQFVDDTVNDADLVAREIIYITGGVLDWEAPPAYSAACEHQNRLVVLPSENPYSFAPSSEWSPGEMVRFSSVTVGYVPSDTGPLTGVASLDGKLLLFTQSALYMTYGDGPDDLGNSQYPPVQRVSSVDVGPLAGTPIVNVPMGLMYQCAKGIVLLGRDLNTQFIGADVETWSTGLWTLRNAFVLAQSQQIRFLLDAGSDLPGAQTGQLVPSMGGVCLVYDYYYNQWSVFPNYGGQASCLYQGNYTMVRSDGVVWQETPGLYLDNGQAYSSLVETEWVKVAGLQGFQRLWYVTLLGTYYSDFTLLFEVAYDFEGTNPLVPTYSEAFTLNGAGQYNLGGPFRFRHHIGHKMEAVKFRISATSVQGSGQGMGLSDMSFEYGVKKGVFRLPAAQSA